MASLKGIVASYENATSSGNEAVITLYGKVVDGPGTSAGRQAEFLVAKEDADSLVTMIAGWSTSEKRDNNRRMTAREQNRLAADWLRGIATNLEMRPY